MTHPVITHPLHEHVARAQDPRHESDVGEPVLISAQVRLRVERGIEAPQRLVQPLARTVLSDTRQRGYATEDGEVTAGLASVAVAVLDHNEHPVAAVAVTYPDDQGEAQDLAEAVAGTAAALTRRIGGRSG